MANVLILGATSDIGVALAKQFAAKGYDIDLASRTVDDLKPIKADILIRYRVSCSIHSFDALDYKSHLDFFNDLNPKPEISICVFGLMIDEKKALEEWKVTENMIATNYTGAVSILNIAAKYYIGQKAGCIVGISSVAGERGRQSKLIYGSAKAAFSAYLSGLRNLLSKEGIQVLSVKPGFVYTKMTEGLPLPKLLTSKPDEVADAVYRAVKQKKNVIYVKWFWRWIMLVIKAIPEPLFKKMNL